MRVLQKYTDEEVVWPSLNRGRAVQSIRVGPSRPAFRSRSQTTSKLLRSKAVGGERWRKSARKTCAGVHSRDERKWTFRWRVVRT